MNDIIALIISIAISAFVLPVILLNKLMVTFKPLLFRKLK